MNEFTEKQPMEKSSFLENADYQEFINRHKIKPEDFQIIENLFSYPTEFFIMELHNFFSFNKENSAQAIKDRIKHINETLKKCPEDRHAAPSLKEKIPFLELFLNFTEKYGWMAARHLNSMLERK